MDPSKDILEYYDSTFDRETRDDLRFAVSLVDGSKIAIDCGCGAGSDIAFLRSQGFLVYAFDVEHEAIARCRSRFKDDANVLLSQATFSNYIYPSASLILADASLFFCPKTEFATVWRKINESLRVNGIFVGSFLGPEDTMADPKFNEKVLWSEALVVSEEKVKHWLSKFEIISFTEHRSQGISFDGMYHQWHIFSVIARKPN